MATEKREPYAWEVLPIARIHPPTPVPHSVESLVKPHTHLLKEDAPVDIKNIVAEHIEQYHGPRR